MLSRELALRSAARAYTRIDPHWRFDSDPAKKQKTRAMQCMMRVSGIRSGSKIRPLYKSYEKKRWKSQAIDFIKNNGGEIGI